MAALNSVFDSLGNYSDSSRKQIFRDILGKVSYLIMGMYVDCIHKNRLVDVILMSTLNILFFFIEYRKDNNNNNNNKKNWQFAPD